MIAKYERGIERPPSSFDMLELLDKYAPQHVVHDEEPPLLEPEASRPTKRQRGDTSGLATSPTSTTAGSSQGVEQDRGLPFEIQPVPAFATGSQQSDQAYDAMMQFLRSMSSGAVAPMTSDSTPGTQSSLSSTAQYTTAANVPPASMPQDALYSDIMNLVDWDMSLQSLQDSHDLFSSGPDGSVDASFINDGAVEDLMGDANQFG